MSRLTTIQKTPVEHRTIVSTQTLSIQPQTECETNFAPSTYSNQKHINENQEWGDQIAVF